MKKTDLIKSKVTWLVIVLIIVVFYQFNSINPISFKSTEYNITDDCGKSFKNVELHSIPEDSICRANCLNFCGTMNEKYVKHYFEKATEGCHICQCWCK